MVKSLITLFQAPYNKRHPLFAVYRFIEWKLIRIFKFSDYKKSVWGDRRIYLNYDSFQSMWIMYNYIVDWEEFNLIRNYIKNGDVVFDIGSNMGFYAIWFSKFIGGNGHVFCFEPDSKNFYRLNKNIELNNLGRQVYANQLAVSDYDGVVKFTKGLDGENHISLFEETNVHEIQCITLNQFLKIKSIAKVSYLKIDVEGFEYAVLSGASDFLSSKAIDIIQLEINRTIDHSGTSLEMLIQLLQRYQYQLCRYDVKAKRLNPIDYHIDRENYFAVSDIEMVNHKLQRSVE